MAVNDVFRCEVYQNVGSEVTMNVLHVRETTPESILPIPAIPVVDMIAAMYAALAVRLSEDWRVIQISARRISPVTDVPVTYVYGAAEAITGSIVGDIIPSQTAVLISLYATATGRRGRGRIFLPGLSEADQNEGQLTEVAHAALQTIVNAEMIGPKGPFAGGDGEWALAVWGTPTGTPAGQDVIMTSVRTNLATQRRRRAFPGFAA